MRIPPPSNSPLLGGRIIRNFVTNYKMIVIKCAKCRAKVFKYLKIGKGRLLHCWEERIIEDYSVRNEIEVKCHCGNLIGIDEGKWIRMKQRSFTCSGTRTKG